MKSTQCFLYALVLFGLAIAETALANDGEVNNDGLIEQVMTVEEAIRFEQSAGYVPMPPVQEYVLVPVVPILSNPMLYRAIPPWYPYYR